MAAPTLDKSRVKPISKKNPSRKPAVSVVFGNDANDWKSVTCLSQNAHPLPPKKEKCDYELLEKAPSTVMDNPDLVLESIQSVHRREFQLPNTMDRHELTFDNTISKKALNGTHFTLGNEDKSVVQSEYSGRYVPTKQTKVQPRYIQECHQNAIIVLDHENRFDGRTSHQFDFVPPSACEKSTDKYKVIIAITKENNSKSSIQLGNGSDSINGRSITEGDYRRPSNDFYVKPTERFSILSKNKKGKSAYQLYDGYEAIAEFKSVQKSDFCIPNDFKNYLESAHICKDTKVYFKKCHFSVECGGVPQEPYLSSTKKDFKTPSIQQEKPPAGTVKSVSVSRKDNNFEVTLNKTITR